MLVIYNKVETVFFFISGDRSQMKDGYREEGVPDMTVMSDINETGINNNLQLRYKNDNIYVSTNLVSIC